MLTCRALALLLILPVPALAQTSPLAPPAVSIASPSPIESPTLAGGESVLLTSYTPGEVFSSKVRGATSNQLPTTSYLIPDTANRLRIATATKGDGFPWQTFFFVTGLGAAGFGSVRDARATRAADDRYQGAIELNPLLRASGSSRPDMSKVIVGKAVVGAIGVLAYRFLPKRYKWLGSVVLWSEGASGEIAKRHNDRIIRGVR